MRLDLIKRVAVAAAYKSAGILRSYLGNITSISKKGATDLVTEADAASEEAIIKTIKKVFPDHAILAEESGLIAGDDGCQWIIDPLDGTTNFTHEFGLFSISIAYAFGGDVVVGIVLSPLTEELFSATKGDGATLNGRPIQVSGQKQVIESLLVTGFPYNLDETEDPLLNRLSHCLTSSQGVRRLGSAAIDLCYVACGRFDAFWEESLHVWDVAAGMLIASEAGAVITDFKNRPFTLDQKEILATNGHIHEEMLSLLEL